MRNGDSDKPNYNRVFYAEKLVEGTNEILESVDHHATNKIDWSNSAHLFESGNVPAFTCSKEYSTLGNFEA